MRTRPLVIGLAFALIASPVMAVVRPTDEPAEMAFAPVPYGPPQVGALGPVVPRPDPGAVMVVRPSLRPVPPSHPVVPVPTPRLIVVETIGDEPEPSGNRASGVASWYCGHGSACTRGYSGGRYAAAGPDLRVGDWRGRFVVVHAVGHSVRVQLIDWCACPSRLLDLYSDAFEALAHYRDKDGIYHTGLDKGVLKVTVSWN